MREMNGTVDKLIWKEYELEMWNVQHGNVRNVKLLAVSQKHAEEQAQRENKGYIVAKMHRAVIVK